MAAPEDRMSPQGRAIIRVAPELIRQALHMPDTATIVAADWESEQGVVELLVESPDLPRDAFPRVIEPTVHHHAERWEWSWGIEVPDA